MFNVKCTIYVNVHDYNIHDCVMYNVHVQCKVLCKPTTMTTTTTTTTTKFNLMAILNEYTVHVCIFGCILLGLFWLFIIPV